MLFTVEERFQASVYSTNVGAPVYYWIASHLDPSYDLFSARRWKAAAMALLAPLVFVTLRRRLGCGRAASAIGGAAVILLPGVAMFAWLATENGLAAVAGMTGLLLVTSRRRAWWAAPVLGGIAITTYTSGVAWAAGIAVTGLLRAWRSDRRGRDLLLVLASGAVGIGIVLLPLAWWTVGNRIVAGGGVFAPADAGATLLDLAGQLAVDGASYYYFSDLPALGSATLAAAAGIALLVAVVRRPEVWPWALVAVATVAVYALGAMSPECDAPSRSRLSLPLRLESRRT